jgi:hypothetical protein
MGLIVEVYKSARKGMFSGMDCTLGGISSKAGALCIVNIDGPFEPSSEYPAALLILGNLPGIVRIVPAEKTEAGGWQKIPQWWMFGGNYAGTSDSRFSEAIERLLGHRFYGAVAIHDRNEG